MAITWKGDPAHSEVQFKVKHLMITTVTGYFKKFDLRVETETENFNTTKKIIFSADIDSIETNSEQRNNHLKSDDFFNAGKFPELKFTSNKYEVSGDRAKLYGDLTIRDVTKPLIMDVEYSGTVTDPYGQVKAGFTVSGKIKRKEFKLMWDAVTEAGNVVVSDDVRIHCEIQVIKQ